MKSDFKKLERGAFIVFSRVFKFFSKYSTYTFGVAFTTSLGGFLIAAYIALFLSATLRFDQSNSGDAFVILFIVLTATIYAPGYYLHFGFLKRLGFKSFTKKLRFINDHINNNEFDENLKDDEALKLLESLEYLPGHNMKAAFIYPTVVMAGVVIQEYIIGSTFNVVFLLLGISSAIFIYIFFTYIAAELLTGNMRRKMKRILVQRGIPFKENFSFSIRQKFIFINFLVLISMFELGLMFYYNSQNIFALVPVLFVISTTVLVGLLLFFYLVSIEQSLLEIESAALDLAEGGRGRLFLAGLDKEMIRTGKGFYAAAMEVHEIRNNLERKVEERTNELNIALEALKEKDAILDNELQVAADIQQSILPSIPPVMNSLRINAFHESMGHVGGDFYDLIPMEGGCTGILIADVSGHGVPAALVTTMAKISFIEAARSTLSPRKIMQKVNDVLSSTVKTQEYLTAFFMVVSPTCDIAYGNASHHHALVLRRESSGIEKWDTNGLFVGAVGNDEVGDTYEEKYDKLKEGDRIFLCTDGLVEERNNEGEEFGQDRLEKILIKTKNLKGSEVKEKIFIEWKHFIGDNEVKDDVTFLIIDVDENSYQSREHRDIALKYIEQDLFKEAIKELDLAIKLDPDDEKNYLHKGKCNLKINEFTSSVANLKKYLSYHPGDSYALYLLAAANYNKKDYELALKAATHSMQLRKGYIKAMEIMARSLEKLGDYDKAKEIQKKIDNLSSKII